MSSKQQKLKKKKFLNIEDFTLVVPLRQIKEIKSRKYFTPCILWAEIELKLGKVEFKRFSKWMLGQTCLREGVYEDDLRSYLSARSLGIKDPYVWD